MLKQTLLVTVTLTLSNALADPTPYLPIDRQVEVDVMDIDAPDDYEPLRIKLLDGYKRNPAFFETHLEEGGTLASLPYDERIGMSVEEFERYVTIIDFELKLRPYGKVSFDAHSDMTGMQLEFATQPSGFPLNGVTYDGETDTFVTKHGTLDTVTFFEASMLDPEIGRWSGVTYSLLDVDQARQLFKLVELRMGQRESDSRYVMVYDLTQGNSAGSFSGFRVIMVYDM
ncbi:MAG: hypothetical protein AAGH76_10155 [Pseudomonadota bacterium]